MNPILRNIIAVVAGWIAGSAVNLGLVQVGHKMAPLEGVDPSDMEALAAAMPDAGIDFLIYPLIAHALGTLVGAAVAALIAKNNKMKFALGIGVLFLLGGIMVSYMLPAPTWFVVTDLVLAYIPMAWLGGKIALAILRNK